MYIPLSSVLKSLGHNKLYTAAWHQDIPGGRETIISHNQ